MAFVNSKEIFDLMLGKNIVISYIGTFDGQMLSLMASNIEDSLWDNPHKGKKFFKIFIELSQNIYLYSKEKSGGLDSQAGVGSLLIQEFDDHFKFVTGNVISYEDSIKLKEKCDAIASKDKDQLREFKRTLRSQSENNGGGNIGMVQVALLTGYPLEYQFHKIDDDKLFYVQSCRIDK